MKTRGLILGLLVALGFAWPAHALRCSDWTRLDAGGRDAVLRSEIAAILESNRAKQFTSLNMARIKQCMIVSIPSIELDFDGICAQGQRADIGALKDLLMRYIRTCAARR